MREKSIKPIVEDSTPEVEETWKTRTPSTSLR